jgi:hypothetical protein
MRTLAWFWQSAVSSAPSGQMPAVVVHSFEFSTFLQGKVLGPYDRFRRFLRKYTEIEFLLLSVQFCGTSPSEPPFLKYYLNSFHHQNPSLSSPTLVRH